ncbi:hypothetical protein DQ04_00241120 [Trypanosoma grayi]|uniref:hypothetical protein n=1 Tax=Trypanosoma grayi TaxID=71804 RepID=UPI0004F474CF|nr:hypothetical protein DQ04_00241120 [Trypanosoma grayi]KEG14970.1 hypothetical protein DQ04_00241120 [Trypanosoma grayi]
MAETPDVLSTTQQGEPPRQLYQVQYMCTHQGYQGTLTANTCGCEFKSELLNVDFQWDRVKWIRMATKHVRDAPTSVIAIKTMRHKGLASRIISSGKYYFYNFNDIVKATKHLQRLKEIASAPNAAALTSAGNLDSPDCDASGNLGVLPADSSSFGRGSSRANQSPIVHSNSNRNVSSPGIILGGRGENRADASSIASPADNESLENYSIARVKRTNNVGEDVEEDADGRNGGRVSMPFIIGMTRHTDARESASVVSQQPRRGSLYVPSKTRRLVPSRTQESFFTRWFGSKGSEFRKRITITAAVLFFVVFLCVLLHVRGDRDRQHEVTPRERVDIVVRELGQLHHWREERQREVLKGNHQRQMQHSSPLLMVQPPPPVCVTLDDMTVVVRELLAQYVEVQRDVVSLRMHRLRRESGDLVPILEARRRALSEVALGIAAGGEEPGEGVGDEDWLHDGSVYKPPRRFSVSRVAADVRRWYRYVQNGTGKLLWLLGLSSSNANSPSGSSRGHPSHNPVHWLTSFWGGGGDRSRSSATADIEKRQLTRYTEFLVNGKVVTQEIFAEDAKERRSCLRLTSELVRLSQLLEGILLEYLDLVMAPQLEMHLYQVPSSVAMARAEASACSSSAHDASLGGNRGDAEGLLTGRNTYLLRSILLRRHALALLRLEPLLQWEKVSLFDTHQQKEQQKQRRSSSSRKTSQDTSNNSTKTSSTVEPTRENIEAILREFVGSMTHSVMKSRESILRNILEEVLYWHEHEEEWQTLVLWRLESYKEDKTSGETPATESRRVNAMDDVIDSLPLFRGLWCFLEKPVRPPPGAWNGSDKGYSAECSKAFVDEKETVENNGFTENSAEKESVENTVEKGSEGLELALVKPEKNDGEDHQKHEEAGMESETLVAFDSNSRPSGEVLPVEAEQIKREENEEDDDIDAHIRSLELTSHEVQLRWVNALELFLRVHGGQGDQLARSGSDRRRSHKEGSYSDAEDQEDSSGSEMSRIRQRTMQLLLQAERLYGRYLQNGAASTSLQSGALLEFMRHNADCRRRSWWELLWPTSWFKRDRDAHPLECCLWRMKLSDPAVRHLYRNALQLPLGEIEDVPWILLHVLTTPPVLLRVQYDARSVFYAASWLLLFAVIATVVVLFFG